MAELTIGTGSARRTPVSADNEWAKAQNRKPGGTTETPSTEFTGGANYAESYTLSPEFRQKITDDFVSQELQTFHSEFERLGGFQIKAGDSENTIHIKASLQNQLIQHWQNLASSDTSSLRERMQLSKYLSLRHPSGMNPHKEALKIIINNIPERCMSQTIHTTDASGIPDGGTMTVAQYLARAKSDSSYLEKYLDSPAVKDAIAAGATNFQDTEKFQDQVRYDKEKPGVGSAIVSGALVSGAAIGTGMAALGTLAAVKTGAAAGTGFGVGFSAASVGAFGGGLSAGLANTVGLVPGIIGGLAASGPLGWIALGLGALVIGAIAVKGGVGAAKYMWSGRNDAPGQNDAFGSRIGYWLRTVYDGITG